MIWEKASVSSSLAECSFHAGRRENLSVIRCSFVMASCIASQSLLRDAKLCRAIGIRA